MVLALSLVVSSLLIGANIPVALCNASSEIVLCLGLWCLMCSVGLWEWHLSCMLCYVVLCAVSNTPPYCIESEWSLATLVGGLRLHDSRLLDTMTSWVAG